MKVFRFVVLVSFMALLASCVNPYAKFYQGLEDARTLPSYEHQTDDIKIISSSNFDNDVKELARRGYQPIGQASFNIGINAVSENQLREQARKVGAHIVLTASQYTHSVSGAMPLTIPQTTTSYTNANATAYGPGGTVNAYGSGTTTTYGNQTVMMPYTVQRADFGAVFLVKVRSRVGITPLPLDDETRKKLQSNAGIKVGVVTEGTPAFEADVLPDDIILAIADEKISSPENYISLLNKYEGKSPVFKIYRDGQTLEKTIQIKHF